MYPNYLEAIVRFYEEKKVNNELPPRMLNTTAAKLKNECVAVYQSRFMKKDVRILRTFLEINESAEILKAIKNGRDKFKPLDNFLKGDTENPEDRHIELLGWLLDFEPRPFDAGYDYGENNVIDQTRVTSPNGETETGTSTGEGSPEPTPPDQTPDESRSRKPVVDERTSVSKIKRVSQNINQWLGRRKVGLQIGGIAALGLMTVLYLNNKETPFGTGSPNKGCMTWNGDNYERVSCDSTGVGGLVLPINEERLKNLHRIKKPDTLTKKHIGNVWYRKRGGDSVDYYTAGGRDPVDLNMDLKRLSLHIFNTYSPNKALKDSSRIR